MSQCQVCHREYQFGYFFVTSVLVRGCFLAKKIPIRDPEKSIIVPFFNLKMQKEESVFYFKKGGRAEPLEHSGEAASQEISLYKSNRM